MFFVNPLFKKGVVREVDGPYGQWSICHTGHDATPWIAFDFGHSDVAIQRVELFNRNSCGHRTQNVDIRISNKLPSSRSRMFSGGTLLGLYAGPATDGEHIVISGEKHFLQILCLHINVEGQEASGRFVIVQMDNGENPLNLEEVKAFGRLVQGGN